MCVDRVGGSEPMGTFMTVFCFNLCTQWFVYRVFGLCVYSLVPTICGITCLNLYNINLCKKVIYYVLDTTFV